MDQMKREVRRAQRQAVNEGAEEIDTWRRSEMERIASAGLTPAERSKEELALVMEVGRRFKRMEGRAKRQNGARGLMEQDARSGRNPLDRYFPPPPNR